MLNELVPPKSFWWFLFVDAHDRSLDSSHYLSCHTDASILLFHPPAQHRFALHNMLAIPRGYTLHVVTTGVMTRLEQRLIPSIAFLSSLPRLFELGVLEAVAFPLRSDRVFGSAGGCWNRTVPSNGSNGH